MYVVRGYALFSDLGLGRGHVANVQYMDFIRIICKANMKDSSDDPFSDLNKAEVNDVQVLMNLRMKNKNSQSKGTG